MNSITFTSPVSVQERSSEIRRIHPAVLQFIAVLPVIYWFVKRLNDGSDEPLGLLTLVFSLYLAWRQRETLQSSRATRICGGIILLFSVIGIQWFPPMIRAGLAVSGLAFWYGVHRRGGLMGLLLLSLPVVASMQFYLGYPLRLAAAEGAVRLLHLGGAVVFRVGTDIQIGGHTVGVDPACGGIRMLWHAMVAAMALAAIHRLRWRATLAAGLLGVALVIPANIFRSTLLVILERGYLTIGLGHGEVGLVSFGLVLLPLWFAVSKWSRPFDPKPIVVFGERGGLTLLTVSALLMPLMILATPRHPAPPDLGIGPELFTFDAITLPLTPLPRTDAEMAFAESFPGTLSSYRWADSQVILRRVNEATRRLHPSRDCLRAAGFDTSDAFTVRLSDGSEWARFHATRDGEKWTVSERITSERNHASWTDISSWYWAAIRQPLNGPWQAETVISK